MLLCCCCCCCCFGVVVVVVAVLDCSWLSDAARRSIDIVVVVTRFVALITIVIVVMAFRVSNSVFGEITVKLMLC